MSNGLDTTRTCPKCRWTGEFRLYFRSTHQRLATGKPLDEWLGLECVRCGYEGREECLDATVTVTPKLPLPLTFELEGN